MRRAAGFVALALVACSADSGALDPGVTVEPPIDPPRDCSALSGCKIVARALNRHGCAAWEDGTVECWGPNDSGGARVGPYTVAEPTPTRIEPLPLIIDLVVGDGHSCGRSADGEVACWGFNLLGQLGASDQAPGSGPIKVDAPSAEAIVAAPHATCIRDALLDWYCWGYVTGHLEALGVPKDSSEVTRLALAPLASGAQELELGGGIGCLSRDGEVSCWDVSGLFSDWASLTMIPLSRADKIATGWSAACALTGREVACWSLAGGPDPIPIPDAGPAKDLVANEDRFCALGEDAVTRCWQFDFVIQTFGPVAIKADLRSQVRLIGGGLICGVQEDSTARCFGSHNGWGLRGDGTMELSFRAQVVRGLTATQVQAGLSQMCALGLDGRVRCWGSVLGLDELRPTPTLVTGIEEAIAIDGSCALLADGSVRCWNPASWSGAPDPPPPSEIVPQEPFVEIAVGDAWRCGRTADHRVNCWAPDTEPDPALENVLEVRAGTEHICSRFNDGSIACWGSNEQGQLGDGSARSTRRSRPTVQVPLPSSTERLFVGGDYSCARLLDRSVWCWGQPSYRSFAELISDRPVHDDRLDDADDIAIGLDGICASRRGRGVSCFGAAGYGVNGTNEYEVIGELSIEAESLARGEYGACAVNAAGEVACWGQGASGVLGNGIVDPEQVFELGR